MDFNTIFLPINSQPKWEENEEIGVLELEDQGHSLIIYNDDVNTFDFVIDCLINICEHTLVQAEQCTFLIHHKGKCSVKNGSMEDLLPKHKSLLSKGLTSEIV